MRLSLKKWDSSTQPLPFPLFKSAWLMFCSRDFSMDVTSDICGSQNLLLCQQDLHQSVETWITRRCSNKCRLFLCPLTQASCSSLSQSRRTPHSHLSYAGQRPRQRDSPISGRGPYPPPSAPPFETPSPPCYRRAGSAPVRNL